MLFIRVIDPQQASENGARSHQTTPPNADELREQIRQSIKAATDAANDAAQEASGNHVRIVNGVPAPPSPPMIHTTSEASDFANSVMPQVVDIANGFFVMCAVMVVGWPLARAFGRRIERRGEVAGVTPGMSEQLQRIEQAVDAMAIEVERISESQRFLTKLQSSTPQHAALPMGDRR